MFDGEKNPHSDDAIRNRIIHMPDDIKKIVTNKFSEQYFTNWWMISVV